MERVWLASGSIPIGPVPQTLQTFAVLGGSAYLGARRGAASMALYVAMGLELPFYASGGHGRSVISGGAEPVGILGPAVRPHPPAVAV